MQPFAIVPLWNSRGQPALGAFADGTWRKCVGTSCIRITWPERWAGYARPRMYRDFWHGTLLQDKADGSGLNYRRNRYYDPATGRFTQEDPIGLAGGLNLYGFAAGDPVTYSDPYGLYVCAQTRAMRRDIERTFQMQIEWGTDGCVRDPAHTTPMSGSRAYSQLQTEFDAAVESPIRFDVRSVRFGWRGSEIVRRSGSHYEILIARFQYKESAFWDLIYSDRRRYGMRVGGECVLHTALFTLESLVVHEFGHAYEVTQGRSYRPEAPAVRRENIYHSIRGEPQRCATTGESFE